MYSPLDDWTDRKRISHKKGYECVYCPEHPAAFRLNGDADKNWIYEHRLVMERRLGRLLKVGESVHHIDETKDHNCEHNLFVCSVDEHIYAHGWRHIFE